LIYAQFLGKTGDSKGAEREFLRILQKDASNHDARFGLALARLESGQTERARQDLLGLAEVERLQSQAQYYLGLIEMRERHFENALRWFEKIQSGSLAFDARVNAITTLIQMGRTDDARQRLEEARKLNPREALRLYLLEAEVLSKAKRYEQSFDLLTKAMEAMPGQVELIYARALMAEHLGRIEILEADLRGVLEKNPDDANALNALGYTLASQTERLEEAKRYIQRAMELKPEDPAILDSYGWLQYRLGEYEIALDYLQRAYKMMPDPEIGAHLGEVLWESGRQQDAKKIWRESLKKDPEHEDMKDVLQRYREAFE
jgi:tetratricopeptide (TPR) repeat protein